MLTIVQCLLLTVGVSAGRHHRQRDFGALDIFSDMVSMHMGKYSNLFTSNNKDDDDFYPEGSSMNHIDREKDQTNIWSQLTGISNLILRPESYRQQQKQKFRRFSAEAPHAKVAERQRQYKENRELDRIAENKELVLDQKVAQKLLERYAKRVEDNHDQKFRASHIQMFDLEHKPLDLMYETEHHTGRLLQASSTNSTDSTASPTVVDSAGQYSKSPAATGGSGSVVTSGSTDSKTDTSTTNSATTASSSADSSSNKTEDSSSKKASTSTSESTSNSTSPTVKSGNTTTDSTTTSGNSSSSSVSASSNQTASGTNKTDNTTSNSTTDPATPATPVTPAPVVTPPKNQVYPKNWNPNVMPDIPLWRVDEKYPDNRSNNSRNYCEHGSVAVPITQNYFMCQDLQRPQINHRVSEYTFKNMTTLPYFRNRYDCKVEMVKNDVCFCPAGYTGYTCDEFEYTKCYVNITTPALYKGCKGEDSEAYVYSIKGFDPCFKFDFTTNTTMDFLLQCRAINSAGLVKQEGHKEGVGYNYENVIRVPTQEQEPKFKYAAVNNDTNLKVMEGEQIMVTVDFRDWKYMSDITRFQAQIKDTSIIAGLKEGSLEVNFNQMNQSDIVNGTRYNVGGRLFFEAHAFSPAYTSFTTNAFLDQEGYSEPQLVRTGGQIVLAWLPAALLILVATSLTLYYCCKEKKVEVEEDNNDYTTNLQQNKNSTKQDKTKKHIK